MSSLISRPASLSDLDIISEIVFSCATRLADRHYPDWSNYYTIDRLKEKLEKQIVFLFYEDNLAIAVVFLSDNDLYYYSKIDVAKFANPKAKGIYISTLSVRPECQGRGITSQIISFCEKYTLQNDGKYLRLDCFGEDELLVNFYKKNGFVVVGPMSEEPKYLLMEKPLT